jgi:hypothetical protein
MAGEWSGVPGFQTTPRVWQEHVYKFEADRDEAIRSGRCFCVCGCREQGTIRQWMNPAMLCDGCSRLNTRRWLSPHQLARRPADTRMDRRDAELAHEYLRRKDVRARRPTSRHEVERVLVKRETVERKTTAAIKRDAKSVFTGQIDLSAVKGGVYVVKDEKGHDVPVKVNRGRGKWDGWIFCLIDPEHLDQRGGMQSAGQGEVYRGYFPYLVSQIPGAKVLTNV